MAESNAPSQTTVPEGWILVPVEPTDAMLEEICSAMDRFGWPVHALQAWRSVLSVVTDDRPRLEQELLEHRP